MRRPAGIARVYGRPFARRSSGWGEVAPWCCSYGGAHGGDSPFAGAEKPPLLSRVVPVSEHVPGYRLGTARRDLTAALAVAAVAVPSAMVYAEVAGLSPVNGPARLKSEMRERFDEGGVTEIIGPTRFYPTVRAAVAGCRAEGRPA
jgi:hypothetical protein